MAKLDGKDLRKVLRDVSDLAEDPGFSLLLADLRERREANLSAILSPTSWGGELQHGVRVGEIAAADFVLGWAEKLQAKALDLIKTRGLVHSE